MQKVWIKSRLHNAARISIGVQKANQSIRRYLRIVQHVSVSVEQQSKIRNLFFQQTIFFTATDVLKRFDHAPMQLSNSVMIFRRKIVQATVNYEHKLINARKSMLS